MPTYYRRPGVYLEESLLVNPSDVANAFTVAAFVGAAEKGPVNEPVLIESWSNYVSIFGGFNPIQQLNPPDINDVTARLTTPVPTTLALLKTHTTYGDTKYADDYLGDPFTAGQYVTLATTPSVIKAYFAPNDNTGVWISGAAPGTAPATPAAVKVISYLPYSVFSFFQNGGRVCWIIRSAPTTAPGNGTNASVTVNGALVVSNLTSFVLKARSPGLWGNNLKYSLVQQRVVGGEMEFALQISLKNAEGNDEVVETFPSLSIKGEIPGTRRIDQVVNDPASGSIYVGVSGVNEAQPNPVVTTSPTPLIGGVDPGIPTGSALSSSAELVAKIEGPVALNVVGYLSDASAVDTDLYADRYQGATIDPTFFADRQDVFVVNDSAKPREPGTPSSTYKGLMSTALGAHSGVSYSASYGPWILIPHPARPGAVISVPPGGAVIGMMSRIDATIGVFRSPAGVIAGLTNAIGVQTKFTDTELGDLNASNINIIRPMVGAGVCVMGGRTRKSYGADRYISARRTLIYIKETLRRSTQFAVFENNDQRLWSALKMSADRILRPLWMAGGLAGSTAAEAYFITCDETINTPAVVQSGEVRMEVGVSLEYPAEFVVIRLTQFDRGTFANEVTPIS